ncbi:hypothetical protein BR93DRAFT_981390 [Coniochaeta sp. PMI_546]|nr:hypothetical protein BR93DRAFT_981390 [Coniochaeta sp. PMI_546]
MCYKLITHTLHCDVRPLVVMGDDVAKPLVDPYATPTACNCKDRDPNIRLRLRCDYGHNCCYMTAKLVFCRKQDCNEAVRFHKYTRRSIVAKDLAKRGPAEEDEGWAPLPVIDGDFCDVGVAPCPTAEFIRAREKFLQQAKGLYEILLQIKKTEADIRQKCIHLLSPVHNNCLYLEGCWEALCGYPTENDVHCYGEHEIEDMDNELLLLESEAEEIRSDFVDYYVQLIRLEDEGHDTITGLDAWD